MLELSGLRDALTSSVWTWPCVAALIGVQIGSFINLLVWRLPQMMQRDWDQQCAELKGEEMTELPVFNLAKPGSHCTSCSTSLRARDLVPVLSFVLLKGRCAYCDAKVSWRYPLVEMAVALLWAFCAWHWGLSAAAVAWAGFATALLALGLIDADTMLLPDSLTLPLMWAGMLLASAGVINLRLEQSVWGAAIGYGSLWLVQACFSVVTGKQGMGQGDFKLLAALGAWLGWMALPELVLVASVSGVLIALWSRWRGQLQAGQAMPFGPPLVFAGLLSAFASSSAWLMY